MKRSNHDFQRVRAESLPDLSRGIGFAIAMFFAAAIAILALG